ncbi:MAG TPA: hypothetical protein VKE74_06555 [Gemmataceae bacterium]|nr:hypothetical protein [Gemmataceae bacterium]
MPHVNPTRVTEEFELPESYPTFWDAIPVDPSQEPSPPTASIPHEDAYAAFTDATEEGRPVILSVEQSDVGQM